VTKTEVNRYNPQHHGDYDDEDPGQCVVICKADAGVARVKNDEMAIVVSAFAPMVNRFSCLFEIALGGDENPTRQKKCSHSFDFFWADKLVGGARQCTDLDSNFLQQCISMARYPHPGQPISRAFRGHCACQLVEDEPERVHVYGSHARTVLSNVYRLLCSLLGIPFGHRRRTR